MGFTIETYQLYGLPALPNIYVTIKGSYSVKKEALLNCYNIAFTVYFQASPNDPVITQKDMNFNIQSLPNPAVLYLIIYDYIKNQLDPYYLSSSAAQNSVEPLANQQVLTFTDESSPIQGP